MKIYNHFGYGEQIVHKLKAIRHINEQPRFFCTNGLEDLFTIDDKLSTINSAILIAADGYESNSTSNRRAFEWFDPIVRAQLPKLVDIVTDYFDTMIIDASRIYIDR